MLKARRSIAVTPNNNACQSPIPKTPFTKLSSLPVKSVQLHKWWLVPADGKGLAVAGFASRERSIGFRTFNSAAIVVRHDNTTLGTADGITVIITSSISRSRTHLNGFPLEVCNHFECGFPSYWEEYANQCHGQASVAKVVPTRSSCFVEEDNMSSGCHASTSQPFSLYETPLTGKRDFSTSPARVLFTEALRKCGCISVHVESARKRKKNTGQFYTPSRSIVTRSMSRMKNIIEKEENLASTSSAGDKKSIISEAAGKGSPGVGTESGSKECRETTFPQRDKKQVVGNTDMSVFRRSSRLMNLKKPISAAQLQF